MLIPLEAKYPGSIIKQAHMRVCFDESKVTNYKANFYDKKRNQSWPPSAWEGEECGSVAQISKTILLSK